MIRRIKLIMAKMGYREWKLVEVNQYLWSTLYIYQCQITGKFKSVREDYF